MNVCEKQVFQQIFQDWNQPLQRYLLAKGVSEPSDIVQDCFVRLWNNCAKVKFEQVGPFLFKIAKNIFIDNYRKKQVRLKYKSHIAEPIERQDGQFQLEESEFKDRLETAIETMPELSKEVFVMHRFDNLSYKEIAKVLEISVKAVEKRMHKALNHMYNQKILRKR